MGIGAPYGWVTLVGPVAMWLFLDKLTGIPATVSHALKSRGEAYRASQRSTSAFVPWFPKQVPQASLTERRFERLLPQANLRPYQHEEACDE